METATVTTNTSTSTSTSSVEDYEYSSLPPTHPATSNSNTLAGQQQGIDIRQALSILSARSEPSENHPHGVNATTSNTSAAAAAAAACGCCHGAPVPEAAKTMGQTIDLMATPDDDSNAATIEETRRLEQEEAEATKKQKAERLEKIQAALNSMNQQELLRAVLQAQEDRVATYRDYETGLQTVLQTGNLTSYPDTCSKATAAFSVLSETIKVVQEILQSRASCTTLVSLIVRLQRHEKEKLHLTAAHHLERIRAQNNQNQQQQQSSSSSDNRVGQLLQEGVQTLQQKIHDCVEQINEVLDELRCSIMEMEEDE